MEKEVLKKYCPGCEQWKDATSQYWHKGNSQYDLHGYCKVCRNSKNPSPKKGGRPLGSKSASTGKKPCPRCGEADLAKFYYSKGKRSSYCKNCTTEEQNARVKANPEKHQENMSRFKEANPSYHRKWAYGLSSEDHQSMFESQFGLCAICGQAPKEGKFHIDHCHTSGVVRGLLCAPCNLMLGLAKDNPELLIRAAKYLKLHAT